MCKKFKFDLVNKWYIHNPESVLENETHKILWDFEINNKNKRSGRIVNFAVPADQKVIRK